ncbi:hypothetical protein JXR01_01395 [Candidatus Kaiserbacteria bacterium]|nr:MAG: hypothetical protein JXR01_01395 [Candidatus Kaiserbacteria bacterium]
MRFIDDMRQRPEEERLAFAAVAAGVVALVLFLLWGVTFFRSDSTIVQVEVSNQGASAIESLRDTTSEIAGTFDEFSVQYQQLKDSLEESNAQESGDNAVNVYVDKDGDVHVDNIIIDKSELDSDN